MLLSFKLGAGWWWMFRAAPWLLHPQYPLYQRVGCPQGQSELAWRRVDFLPPEGFEPAVIQPMTNLTYIQYVYK